MKIKLSNFLITVLLGLSTYTYSVVASDEVDGRELHDPTKPALSYLEEEKTTSSFGDIKISGVFVGDGQNKVLIGSKSYTVGDQLAGATIVTIDEEGIELKKKDGGIFEAKFPYTVVKTIVDEKE